MRSVAFVTTYTGSLINFRLPLLQEFAKKGYKVHIVAPSFSDDLLLDLASFGFECHTIHVNRKSLSIVTNFFYFINSFRFFLKLKPYIAVCYFPKPVLLASLAARLAGVPHRVLLLEGLGYFFTPTSSFNLFKFIFRSFISLLYVLVLPFSTHIIFLNRFDLKSILKIQPFVHHKCHLWGPIGVFINPSVPLYNPPDPPTFTFVGRLLVEKGIVEFINAANIVSLFYPDVRFFVVGDEDDNFGSITLQTLQSLSNSPQILFAGQTDPQPYLLNSTAFVLPSYREGFSRSLQEAMALRLPIITTSAPGCLDSISHNVHGLIVPPRTVHPLANAMITLIRSPSLCREFSYNSFLRAQADFDFTITVSNFFAILDISP